MGRFSNLEFVGREKEEPEAQATAEPRDEQYYLRRADELYRSARFEKALRLYSRALEFNPNIEAGWIGQVRMLIELGEYREAQLWADKALGVFRDQPDVLASKAVAHVRLGDGQKGLQFSDASLGQKGSSAYAWLARAEVMLARGQGNDEYCFMKARAAEDADWFLELLIARIFYFYRHYAMALTCAKKVTGGRSDSAFAWHVAGDCQFTLGMERSARSSYEQALLLDADFERSRAALQLMNSRGLFAGFLGRLKRFFAGG